MESLKVSLLTTTNVADLIDVTQKVPIISIIAMVFSLIVLIAVPVAYFIYLKNRGNIQMITLLGGLVAYMAGTGIVAQVIYIGITFIKPVNEYLINNSNVSLMVSILISVTAELVSIFAIYKLLFKKIVGFDNGLLFGLGFFIGEIISTVGMSLFSSISLAMAINSNGIEAMFEGMEQSQIEESVYILKTFLEISTSEYLVQGIHTVFGFMFRIGLIVLIYMMFEKKLPMYFIAIVIAVRCIFTIPYVLYGIGIVNSVVVEEIIFAAITILFSLGVLYVMKEKMPEEIEKLKEKSNKKSKNKPAKMPKIVMPKD